jgi:hypothetical protein
VQDLELEHEQTEKVSENIEEDDVNRRIRELKAQKIKESISQRR